MTKKPVFTKKLFWVLVIRFLNLVSVDAKERSYEFEKRKKIATVQAAGPGRTIYLSTYNVKFFQKKVRDLLKKKIVKLMQDKLVSTFIGVRS